MTSIDEDKLLEMAFSSIEWCKELKKEILNNERKDKGISLELLENCETGKQLRAEY